MHDLVYNVYPSSCKLFLQDLLRVHKDYSGIPVYFYRHYIQSFHLTLVIKTIELVETMTPYFDAKRLYYSLILRHGEVRTLYDLIDQKIKHGHGTSISLMIGPHQSIKGTYVSVKDQSLN